MEINALPFDTLPFSALFKHLINEQKDAVALFEFPLFEADQALSNFSFQGDRTQITQLISRFNESFDASTETLKNIERLRLPESVCVITGQQLAIFGGPVYTLYKIISAIALARRLEQHHQRPVIPVFWLADEDHDIDETVNVQLIQKGSNSTHTYSDPHLFPIPVADRVLSDGIDPFLNEVFDHLETTPFTHTLREQLQQAYQPGATFRTAFGKLIMQWFGKYGLVLAGSNDPEIKAWLRPVLKTAVQEADSVYKALEVQTLKVETAFKRQAQISDSLLFYLDPEANKARYRIKHEQGAWFTEQGHRWSTAELIDLVERFPQQVSPNVFFRPMLQDHMLPTLAYVAGPGELAYYAQMNQLYRVFGLHMPLITPRHSATILDASVTRNLHQLPFTFQDYQLRIEDLEKSYITQHQSINADQWALDWIELLRKASESAIAQLSSSEPTLRASAEKTLAETEASITKIKQKWIKSLKEKEQTALQRIQRVKNTCFPEQEPQERVISTIYFLNKFGMDVIDELLTTFQEHKADHHYLIHL